MSEQFYNKVLALLSGFSVFLVLLIANIEFLFFYISQQNPLFYYAWLGFLVIPALYGIRYYRNFQDFKTNLSLFIPNEANNELDLEPLNLETDDKALRICLFYERGSSLEHIKNELSLNHATTVQRELRKGLRFLLTFYNEHKHEGVKTT